MLRPPGLSVGHQDRILELEEEMEAHVIALMDRARDAGWHQEETMLAVVSLARNYVLRLEANLQTDIEIAKAIAHYGPLH